MSRREIEDYLIERSLTEPQFRDALLGNPNDVLRQLGLPVGDNVEIRILEESSGSFYLVLPRTLRDRQELDDADIDSISGGTASNGPVSDFFKGYL